MLKQFTLIVAFTLLLVPEPRAGFYDPTHPLTDTLELTTPVAIADSSDILQYNDTLNVLTDSTALLSSPSQEGRFPINFIHSFEKDSLRSAWFQYLSSLKQAGMDIKPSEEQFMDDYEQQIVEELKNNDSTQVITEVVQQQAMPETVSLGITTNYAVGDTALYTFYVQIAASRTPMDSAELKRLYKGTHQVVVHEENGWHKYRFGKTTNYKEAFTNLYAQKIPDAFIVVYKNTGLKMELWEVLRERRKAILKAPENTSGNITEFRIQLAASRSPMGQDELDKIYKGRHTIVELQEEGWYKYQVVSGSNYTQARALEKEINASKAFIVVYENQTRAELYKVLLRNKSH